MSKEKSCHRSSGADSETGHRGTASRLGSALCVFLEYICRERESIVFSNVLIDLLHWRYSNYSFLHMQTSKLAFGATSKRCKHSSKHSMFDLASFIVVLAGLMPASFVLRGWSNYPQPLSWGDRITHRLGREGDETVCGCCSLNSGASAMN